MSFTLKCDTFNKGASSASRSSIKWLSLLLVSGILLACDDASSPRVTAVSAAPSGPTPVIDSDGDGVVDAVDQCPNTTVNDVVGAQGCSVASCHQGAGAALQACFSTVAAQVKTCYIGSVSAPCASSDPVISGALNDLATAVTAACPTDSSLRAAGYGDMKTTSALVTSLQDACSGQVATLAARIFGGPHGKLTQTTTNHACLDVAFTQAASVIVNTYQDYSACILDSSCNGSTVEANRATRDNQATTQITASCPAMENTMGSSPQIFLERANAQARCMVAEGHGDTSNVALDCGPDNHLFNQLTLKENSNAGASITSVDDIALGQDVFVSFDSAGWGSLCGDGSDYAVMMRLAPDGNIEKVLMEQEGGGVCLAGTGDCTQIRPGLFEAQSRDQSRLDKGYHKRVAGNPFKDWSKLFQPYCTQDLHIGGGAMEPGGPPANNGFVRRYGAINVRTSTRFFRDLIWRRMRHTTATGYLPSQPKVVFSGTSAGGYGVQYNLHYPLDELRLENTLANPHVAFVVGGGTTDISLLFTTVGNTWATRPYQPPYCLEDGCSTTEVNHPAHAERLGATPLQKILQTTPQHDDTQEPTQGYPGPTPTFPGSGFEEKDWINEMRRVYCTLKDTPNLYFHMGANDQPVHDFINTDAAFDYGVTYTRQLLVNGSSMVNWLHAAMEYPEQVMDRVETGDTLPGANNFNCSLVSPVANGDFDGDSVTNVNDVCPGTINNANVALNGCAIGVNDADQDGIQDAIDRCVNTSVTERASVFGCAPSQDDIDGDGILDPNDNCPSVANSGQENLDGDFLGDACDN